MTLLMHAGQLRHNLQLNYLIFLNFFPTINPFRPFMAVAAAAIVQLNIQRFLTNVMQAAVDAAHSDGGTEV